MTLWGGILNALHRFAAAAAAPILLNLSMMATLALAAFFGGAGYAAAWGVLISGVLQALLVGGDTLARRRHDRRFARCASTTMCAASSRRWCRRRSARPARSSRCSPTPSSPAFSPTGAISALYYADRIDQLPIGVIGIAVGTVLLPEMTHRIAAGDDAGARSAQNRAIEFALLLAIPCIVAFLVVPDLIMRGLFMRGRFTADDAHAAAMTLMAYTIGLVPFVLIRSVVAPFLARGDTLTPVKAALIGTAVNIVFKIALMGSLAQVGLALATSIGAWINFILVLWFAGARRPHRRRCDAQIVAAPSSLAAGLLFAVFLLIAVARRHIAVIVAVQVPRLNRNCWCWRCSAACFTAALVLALFGRRWLSLMRGRAQTAPAAPLDAFEGTPAAGRRAGSRSELERRFSMRVTMIGAGYVGLVSGACFADFGHHVTCIDKDAQTDRGAQARRDSDLRAGPRRSGRGQCARRAGLHFAAETAGVAEADAVFIAVGTPSRRGDGHADLSFVYRRGARDRAAAVAPRRWWSPNRPCRSAPATRSSASCARCGPTPTCRSSPTRNSCAKAPRSTISSIPDRIVVGTDDARARAVMAEIYRPLYLNAAPILYVSRRTAELIKYAANAFLATKITFINEIADLCEQVGADVQEVARGMGLDNRIGGKFLHAGPGLRRLVLSEGHRRRCSRPRTITACRCASSRRSRRSTSSASAPWRARWSTALGGSVRGKTIAVLGLTFKPNTDDMRNSPSIPLITALQDLGATVRGYDPAGMEQAKPQLPDVIYCGSAYEAAEGADAVVIATEWEQFRALDLDRLRCVMARPVIVDLRNIYRAEEMKRANFRYLAVGRPSGGALMLESPLPRRRKAATERQTGRARKAPCELAVH